MRAESTKGEIVEERKQDATMEEEETEAEDEEDEEKEKEMEGSGFGVAKIVEFLCRYLDVR